MSGCDDRQRALAAAAKRRQRKREKDGSGYLQPPVRDLDGVSGALAELRWLKWSESEDRERINRAVGMILDDLAAWYRAGCPPWTDERPGLWQGFRHD